MAVSTVLLLRSRVELLLIRLHKDAPQLRFMTIGREVMENCHHVVFEGELEY